MVLGKKKSKNKDQIEQTAQRLREITTTEYYELFELLRTPKKLIWLNFLIGLSRGFGLAIGLTLLGGVVIAIITITVKQMVSVPVLGKYITEIISVVKANMGPQ